MKYSFSRECDVRGQRFRGKKAVWKSDDQGFSRCEDVHFPFSPFLAITGQWSSRGYRRVHEDVVRTIHIVCCRPRSTGAAVMWLLSCPVRNAVLA